MAWETLLDKFNTNGIVPDGIEVVGRPSGEDEIGPVMPIVRCRSYRGQKCNRQVSIDMMYKVDGIYVCDGCVDVIRVREGRSIREMTDRIGGHRADAPVPTRPYSGGRRADDA